MINQNSGFWGEEGNTVGETEAPTVLELGGLVHRCLLHCMYKSFYNYFLLLNQFHFCIYERFYFAISFIFPILYFNFHRILAI